MESPILREICYKTTERFIEGHSPFVPDMKYDLLRERETLYMGPVRAKGTRLDKCAGFID